MWFRQIIKISEQCISNWVISLFFLGWMSLFKSKNNSYLTGEISFIDKFFSELPVVQY